jgi:hypothetical protein
MPASQSCVDGSCIKRLLHGVDTLGTIVDTSLALGALYTVSRIHTRGNAPRSHLMRRARQTKQPLRDRVRLMAAAACCCCWIEAADLDPLATALDPSPAVR